MPHLKARSLEIKDGAAAERGTNVPPSPSPAQPASTHSSPALNLQPTPGIRTIPPPNYSASQMNSGSAKLVDEQQTPPIKQYASPGHMSKKSSGSAVPGNEPAVPAATTGRSPGYAEKMNTAANPAYTNELYQQPSVEEKSYQLRAKDLSITWADDTNYWNWKQVNEPPKPPFEVAELVDVCWLDVSGKFNTRNLPLGSTYYVAFIVKLQDPAYGWDKKVNLELILPDGGKKLDSVEMRLQKRYQWIEIRVGEFTVSPENMGEIKFSMYERESGGWKKGLVIKGAIISPKKPATASGPVY